MLHEITRVVSRFPLYISCHIAENRLPLGQCGSWAWYVSRSRGEFFSWIRPCNTPGFIILKDRTLDWLGHVLTHQKWTFTASSCQSVTGSIFMLIFRLFWQQELTVHGPIDKVRQRMGDLLWSKTFCPGDVLWQVMFCDREHLLMLGCLLIGAWGFGKIMFCLAMVPGVMFVCLENVFRRTLCTGTLLSWECFVGGRFVRGHFVLRMFCWGTFCKRTFCLENVLYGDVVWGDFLSWECSVGGRWANVKLRWTKKVFHIPLYYIHQSHFVWKCWRYLQDWPFKLWSSYIWELAVVCNYGQLKYRG